MSTLVEGSQIVLRLTTNEEVLDQMRRNKVLVKNEHGEEVLVLQFDSKAYTFRRGTALVLGKSVANALIRDSAIIIGDPNDPDYQLTGEYRRALDTVRSINASEGVAQNICPHCSATADGKRQPFTPGTLGYHMQRQCPIAAKVSAQMDEDSKPKPEPKAWTPPPKTLSKNRPQKVEPSTEDEETVLQEVAPPVAEP